ncbi:hypothetical protein FACS1894139_03360 [Planctomycetales bacterium]|nr:hypothetical protein FACS1894107_11320 [Planctomycetales bacterium]GHT03334.1 hypothetical protein FACS1894139_03360 [Planctomycetales bacterium]
MNLSKYLPRAAVLLLAEELTKEEVLARLRQALLTSPYYADFPASQAAAVEEMLLHREAQHAPTGLGSGIAFPHARVQGLPRPGLAMAVLRQPVDFRAIDNQPAQIVCLLLVPDNNPLLSLHLQSQSVRLLMNAEMRRKIIAAPDAETVYRLFGESEIELDRSLAARDVMQKISFEIKADTPLRSLTHWMSQHATDCAAVTGDGGEIIGQITCKRLFHFGLPEFFSQLKSVSFIKDFDPFEKYFFQESQVSAAHVMTTDFCAMPPDATILEVVFALSTENYPCVFVVEDGKLVGVIDQRIVLEQIINF